MTKQELLDKLNRYKFTTHKVVLVKKLPSKMLVDADGREYPAFENEQEELIETYNNEELADFIFDNKIKT